jgi:hypothetical protein
MCFENPYWQSRYCVFDSEIDGNIVRNDFSVKRANEFCNVTEKQFKLYAKALKNIEILGTSNDALKIFPENVLIQNASKSLGYNIYIESIFMNKIPLLYVDMPKFEEYDRQGFNYKKCLDLMHMLVNYQGDWILTKKIYGINSKNRSNQLKQSNEMDNILKSCGRTLYQFRFISIDSNVRNGIRFITTINFDDIQKDEFIDRYNIDLSQVECFERKIFK